MKSALAIVASFLAAHLDSKFPFTTSSPPSSKPPNVIVFLVDDQDELLGGLTPIQKSINTIFNDANSTRFTNSYTVSPLCCPSRASLLTGRFPHNHGAKNNTVNGGCASQDYRENSEPFSIANLAKQELNYTTFFAGKYLNQYKNASHVPPGWDSWYGLLGNSRYFNYSLSENGKKVRYKDDESHYLTNVIKRNLLKFIDTNKNRPFLAFASTPACHAPWDSETKYKDFYRDLAVPDVPSYNYTENNWNRHWMMRRVAKLSSRSYDFLIKAHRGRWRTLRTVDDMMIEVYDRLKDLGIDGNTYIIFTSDNGYHLGNFGLPIDKRQLYDTDVRVPLFIRKPTAKYSRGRGKVGIRHNPTLVSNIDLAPTILDLVGVPKRVWRRQMDGDSLKSSVVDDEVKSRRVYVEYYGEAQEEVGWPGCPNTKGLAQCFPDCVCDDAINNTYTCSIDHKLLKTCQFTDDEDFVEIYNTAIDPYELQNLYTPKHSFSISNDIQPVQVKSQSRKIRDLTSSNFNFSNCKLDECRMLANL